MRRPAAGEYAPYFATYIDLVPGDDLLAAMAEEHAATLARLTPLDEVRAMHRYAPGKWSVKQVIQHVTDCERIFTARALAFARGDTTPLPGFDHDAYVEASDADERDLVDILAEFAAVRASTVELFGSFAEPTLDLVGTANDNRMSVRAIGFTIVGHELHHRGVLEARYAVD